MSPQASPSRNPNVFIWRAKGASRILYLAAEKITEAFDKASAPEIGSISIAFSDRVDDLEDDNFIIGLAVTRGVAGIASGTVRATMSPIFSFSRPIAVNELADSKKLIDLLPTEFHSAQLPEQYAARILAQLGELDAGAAAWIRRVTAGRDDLPTHVEQARIEARDAIEMAAQIADVDLPADSFTDTVGRTDETSLLDSIIADGYQYDLEEELLPLDLQRFDGKLVGEYQAASFSVFRDRLGEAKLAVFTVNKKPVEEVLGVDLLYWDQIHDAFTFVQYKRLERVKATSGPGQWAYKKRSEIEKQLRLMPAGRARTKRAEDWRSTDTPFWFKFVRGDAATRLDGKVLKGMYVPADWLRLAIDDDTLNTGPRGGFQVTYDNAKYIGRTAFVQLVSRGFVGTTRERSAEFKKIVKRMDRSRELIVAVRGRWSEDDEASEPSNDGGPDLPF